MIACKYRMLRRLKSGLKAVGRMPLTNALIQMTVLGWIFYGHGLGLYGTLDRMALLRLSGGFAVIQLVISPFWLRAFRFGPVEWLWRCFAYGRSLNLLHFATIARSH